MKGDEEDDMRKLRFAIPWLLALAAGCGATVRATTTPGTNLSRYRTFGFAQPVHPSTQTAAFLTSPAGQTAQNAIARDLESKGLQQATQNPDFLIAIHEVVQQEEQLGEWDYFGPPAGYQYTQGTIIVDFIDPATRNVFWRGTATDVVLHPENPDLGKLSAAVDKLMQQYPSQVATAGRAPPM
jgi:hypothetical protein